MAFARTSDNTMMIFRLKANKKALDSDYTRCTQKRQNTSTVNHRLSTKRPLFLFYKQRRLPSRRTHLRPLSLTMPHSSSHQLVMVISTDRLSVCIHRGPIIRIRERRPVRQRTEPAIPQMVTPRGIVSCVVPPNLDSVRVFLSFIAICIQIVIVVRAPFIPVLRIPIIFDSPSRQITDMRMPTTLQVQLKSVDHISRIAKESIRISDWIIVIIRQSHSLESLGPNRQRRSQGLGTTGRYEAGDGRDSASPAARHVFHAQCLERPLGCCCVVCSWLAQGGGQSLVSARLVDGMSVRGCVTICGERSVPREPWAHWR